MESTRFGPLVKTRIIPYITSSTLIIIKQNWNKRSFERWEVPRIKIEMAAYCQVFVEVVKMSMDFAKNTRFSMFENGKLRENISFSSTTCLNGGG